MNILDDANHSYSKKTLGNLIEQGTYNLRKNRKMLTTVFEFKMKI